MKANELKINSDNLGILFAPGDIITTYHAGYWRLKEIQRRFITKDHLKYDCYKHKNVGDEYSPIFVYEQVLTKDFKPCKKLTKECDAAYCQKVTKESIEKKKKEYSENLDKLIGLL